MTVKELITILEQEENQDKDVYVYVNDNGDIFPIRYVDLDLTDRVDLTITMVD